MNRRRCNATLSRNLRGEGCQLLKQSVIQDSDSSSASEAAQHVWHAPLPLPFLQFCNNAVLREFCCAS